MTKSCFVLFGATGDLAKRMLWPSLFHLYCEGLMAETLEMTGTASADMNDTTFRAHVSNALDEFADDKLLSENGRDGFLQRIRYFSMTKRDDTDYQGLKRFIGADERTDILFYLSVPPAAFEGITKGLGSAGLANPNARVIIEKPIGHDLASSKIINDAVAMVFDEEQTFRIDHYLGKETVQNLMALRFANSLFEPIWNASAIDHVQITVAETVGVGGRWGYYNKAGALRDMMQNHILQLVALTAMEPPSSLEPAAVRNEKIKVLSSLRPVTAETVSDTVVPAQYDKGVSEGQSVPGYMDEEDADENSNTESYIAIRAFIDNWRWKGVPFYLRTGKRMPERRTEIVVQFRDVPHNIFAENNILQPNRLLISLQPQETIKLQVMNKEPGLDGVTLRPVELNLSLTEAFNKERRRIAYERLILDGLNGNSTLFVRRDELEAAWLWIDGIKEAIDKASVKPKSYAAGSWGPVTAASMAENNGVTWND